MTTAIHVNGPGQWQHFNEGRDWTTSRNKKTNVVWN